MVGTHTALRGGGPSNTATAAVAASTAPSLSTRTATRSSTTRPAGTAHTTSTTSASPRAQTLTGPMRGEWTSQAAAPQLHGSRAAAWIAMWDKGSAVRRVSLLETLRKLHAESNSSAMEDDLGDAAPLFFARLTSWWKLRYAAWVVEARNGAVRSVVVPASTNMSSTTAAAAAAASSPQSSSELLAQVEAITIFVRGSRYLLQFVEGGGAAALCDCLAATSSIPLTASTAAAAAVDGGFVRKDGYARERRAMTLLLLHIAHSGRVYREMVGDVANLQHLLHALQRETEAGVAIPITDLITVLGKGRPGLAGSVNTGLLRVMASALHPTDDIGEGNSEESKGCYVSGGGGSVKTGVATSEVVVLSAARAVRALQLQAEQQHYVQHAPAEESEVVAARVLDYVPIVGLDAAVSMSGGGGGGGTSTVVGSSLPAHADPLLVPFTTQEYLSALFRLALEETHTAYRVEGNELLNLAAKNIHLTPRILTRCLDVVDDDVYTLDTEESDEAGGGGVAPHRLRRQRRQLSCGRAAVLILISRPMTAERRSLLLHLVAQRGGHLTLLKYLRLTQHGDSAAVVNCCHALQFITRASTDAQRRQRMGQAATSASSGGRPGAEGTVLARITEGVQAALGEAVFQQLLFQELSEEDCMAILRSARAAVAGCAL